MTFRLFGYHGDPMKRFLALFRGINVGGKNSLPMREQKAILEELGAQSVRTYIQSGNVVFHYGQKSAGLAERIGATVEERHGFRPHVLLLNATDLEKAIACNPFPEAERDPKSLHVFFLDSTPAEPDLTILESIKIKSERFVLQGDLFYLHAPDGVGRSKLAGRAEKALGVPATARNWRTIRELAEMINS